MPAFKLVLSLIGLQFGGSALWSIFGVLGCCSGLCRIPSHSSDGCEVGVADKSNARAERISSMKYSHEPEKTDKSCIPQHVAIFTWA